ncbi:hypothetical protein EJB05_07745, partial [Eragrostis curvula]
MAKTSCCLLVPPARPRVVYLAAGEPLTIEEIIVDPPKAYEVRVKIICTSLCHTDITFWRAKIELASAFPRILGHEAYGVVESVGEHVEEFAPGDTVAPTCLGQCDSCSSCTSEHKNMCTAVPFIIGPGMRRDGTSRFRDSQGTPLHDCMAVSSFSEYTVVDMNQVVKLDPSVPPKIACLLSCGAGTGVGAAWKLAKVEPGSSVAVFGLGSVGLSAVQGAKLCGATKIIGVDLNPDKEKVGKTFGVTDFVNPSQLDKRSVPEAIIELTGGGVDYSFECIGVSSVMTDAFRSTKPGGGKTIVLGSEQGGEPVCLPSIELLFGKCIMGSLLGGIKPKTDIPILAKKCMNKELELEGLVTHEVGLKDINKAFELLVQGKSLSHVTLLNAIWPLPPGSFCFCASPDSDPFTRISASCPAFSCRLRVSMEEQSSKPIRCKGATVTTEPGHDRAWQQAAAVCRAAGEPLTIEEIVVDPPKAYEIRIKIICTSLCYTDITFWRNKIAPVFPRILGHEAYGVVESVGEHVEGFAPGDAVVPTFLGQCNSCSSCTSEHNNMCNDVPFIIGPGMRRDGTTRFRDSHGNPLHDLLAVSSFSEYTVVDMNQVAKLDPSVPPKIACILSCGAGTGVGGAWKLAKVHPGSSVAVFGLGSVGLAAIIELTGGGADYSFECIGVSSVMTDAFRSIKPGNGKTIILGLEKDSEPVCLPSIELLFGKCVMGSLFGGIKPKTDIPILAEKCMNKELELDGLITHEVGLQDINTAFDLLLQGKSLRCIIWMDHK